MKATAWLGLCAAVVLAAAARAEDAGKGADKLTGTWKFVSGEKEGEKLPEERLKTPVKITKDQIKLEGPNEDMTFTFEYKLDTSKTPWHISLKGLDNVAKGSTAEGIVEVKGDELKLCYAVEGGKPPTEFKTKEGDKHHLFVLKKAK
jgi:uncharacterized protein (TIGR03067 family)